MKCKLKNLIILVKIVNPWPKLLRNIIIALYKTSTWYLVSLKIWVPFNGLLECIYLFEFDLVFSHFENMGTL